MDKIGEWITRPSSNLKEECRVIFVAVALCLGIVAVVVFGLSVFVDATQTIQTYDPMVWAFLYFFIRFIRWIFDDD